MNKAQLNKNTDMKAGELMYVQATMTVKGAQQHLVEEQCQQERIGPIVKVLECFVKSFTFCIWPLRTFFERGNKE